MKKLMLAALVAVTAAVVSAGVSVYDVAFSAKTTQGKTASAKTTKYAVNFGMDAQKNGRFWYTDGAIVQNAEKGWYGDVGQYQQVIVYDAGFKTSRGRFSNAFELLEPEDKLEVVKALSYNPSTKKTKYNYKSANRWCATVKFSVTDPAQCYRTTGSRKLKGYLMIDDSCCGAGGWYWSDTGDFKTNRTAVSGLKCWRIGSSDPAKATKVEAAFSVGNGAVFGLQGSYDAKNGRVSSLSGSCVATLPPPVCESCCSAPETAAAFDLCGNRDASPDCTVAFGSVTAKFNKKLTEKVAAELAD